MKMTVLSRSGSIPSTKRLVEAARTRGHRVRVLNPVKVEMHLDGRTVGLYYQRKKLAPTDVVIPRIAQSVSTYGLAVVNQFGILGVPLVNSAQAIAQSRNKMRTLQLLSQAGIDIPSTVMARQASDLKEMVSLVGGVPVLVKLLQGQERHGVMVCESLQSLKAALEAILGLGHNLIVQQYVRETGRDIRVLVVGGEAVAAARLVGLEVAAVDLLDVKDAPKVFEVNSSPALTEMEAATGVDLAARIIRRAEEMIAIQPQDVQRGMRAKFSVGDLT